MSVRLNRRGATLPLTILVLAIMGVAVAISYYRLSSERHLSSDSQAQLDAFGVAQSGLNNYLAGRSAKPPASQDTTFTTLPNGTAVVSLRMLRESTTTLLPAVYVVTSRGTATSATRFDSRVPAAERTVAAYALWTPAPIDVDAGITSLSGLTLNGASTNTHLSGVDNCGAAASIPGVGVTTGGGVNGTSYNGNTPQIDGTPDNTPTSLGTPGAAGTAKDQVSIDWAAIVAGTALAPNYIYNNTGWPTAAQFLNWPIVRANGDLALNGGMNGQGILIVTGNLSFSGSPRWDGLVLVGGAMTSNGNNQVYGATITGLNVKLGQAVGVSTIANGAKIYQYDSCALARALGKIGSLQVVRNGWTDTWSSY